MEIVRRHVFCEKDRNQSLTEGCVSSCAVTGLPNYKQFVGTHFASEFPCMGTCGVLKFFCCAAGIPPVPKLQHIGEPADKAVVHENILAQQNAQN
jgi:hypothetical protein